MLCKNRGCGRLPVMSGWCWDCAHERQAEHEPLPFLDWDDRSDFD